MRTNLPDRPTVSFVLATYNRGAVVADCLRRTLMCGLPLAQFSITVVDNASTDSTADLVENLSRHHPNIKLIRLAKNCGPVAKNAALYKNPADIVVILDDDAYPLPGAVAQMIRHFQDDAQLGAAVFDVTLPDGAKEASAYPDVFIGAGTGLRGEALRARGATDSRFGNRKAELPLPRDFFMQAEEYDLSFRLLAAGWSIQRFWDMPLMHLKTPGARIGDRTTRLDVRNNLWLLAKYIPEPLCWELSADWLARYWRMAVGRDHSESTSKHRAAFMRGAKEGLAQWKIQRGNGRLLLNEPVIEKIFKFETIRVRMARAKERLGLRRIAFGDWGKNMLPYWRAAQEVGLEVTAIVDGHLTQPAPATGEEVEYRGTPVINEAAFREDLEARVDGVIITAMSRIHADRRLGALRRVLRVPVIDLFGKTSAIRTADLRTSESGMVIGV